jgi:hypothetical protein
MTLSISFLNGEGPNVAIGIIEFAEGAFFLDFSVG